MPNFLGWMEDPKSKEFGALVQFDKARTVQPQVDGSVKVIEAPRTEFCNEDRITRMREVAGPGSKDFWDGVGRAFSLQRDMHQNMMDITGVAEKPAAPERRYSPEMGAVFRMS